MCSVAASFFSRRMMVFVCNYISNTFCLVNFKTQILPHFKTKRIVFLVCILILQLLQIICKLFCKVENSSTQKASILQFNLFKVFKEKGKLYILNCIQYL